MAAEAAAAETALAELAELVGTEAITEQVAEEAEVP